MGLHAEVRSEVRCVCVIKHNPLLGWIKAVTIPPSNALPWCVRRFYCFSSYIVTEYVSMICENKLLPSFLLEYRSVGWWKTIPPPLFCKQPIRMLQSQSLWPQIGCRWHHYYNKPNASSINAGLLHNEPMSLFWGSPWQHRLTLSFLPDGFFSLSRPLAHTHKYMY